MSQLGRLRRFGRGPVNVGCWRVRDVTPAATRAAAIKGSGHTSAQPVHASSKMSYTQTPIASNIEGGTLFPALAALAEAVEMEAKRSVMRPYPSGSWSGE